MVKWGCRPMLSFLGVLTHANREIKKPKPLPQDLRWMEVAHHFIQKIYIFDSNCSLRSDKNCQPGWKLNAISIWITGRTSQYAQSALLWHLAAARPLAGLGRLVAGTNFWEVLSRVHDWASTKALLDPAPIPASPLWVVGTWHVC